MKDIANELSVNLIIEWRKFDMTMQKNTLIINF